MKRVSLELAKSAKEKGFDESCDLEYSINGSIVLRQHWEYEDGLIKNSTIKEDEYSAPNKSELQNWLRDVKLVSVDLSCSCNRDGFTYMVSVSTIKGESFSEKMFDSRYLTDPKSSLAWPLVFTDYYEALEYGLVEGLKEI